MLRSSTPDAVVLTLGDEFIFLGGLLEEVLSLMAVSNISGLQARGKRLVNPEQGTQGRYSRGEPAALQTTCTPWKDSVCEEYAQEDRLH